MSPIALLLAHKIQRGDDDDDAHCWPDFNIVIMIKQGFGVDNI